MIALIASNALTSVLTTYVSLDDDDDDDDGDDGDDGDDNEFRWDESSILADPHPSPPVFGELWAIIRNYYRPTMAMMGARSPH